MKKSQIILAIVVFCFIAAATFVMTGIEVVKLYNMNKNGTLILTSVESITKDDTEDTNEKVIIKFKGELDNHSIVFFKESSMSSARKYKVNDRVFIICNTVDPRIFIVRSDKMNLIYFLFCIALFHLLICVFLIAKFKTVVRVLSKIKFSDIN